MLQSMELQRAGHDLVTEQQQQIVLNIVSIWPQIYAQDPWRRTWQSTPGLPWQLRWQSICLQCRRPGFSALVGKIPCGRKSQPTSVFLPGEFHGPRSLVGYNPRKELDTTEQLHSLTHIQLANLKSDKSPFSTLGPTIVIPYHSKQKSKCANLQKIRKQDNL